MFTNLSNKSNQSTPLNSMREKVTMVIILNFDKGYFSQTEIIKPSLPMRDANFRLINPAINAGKWPKIDSLETQISKVDSKPKFGTNKTIQHLIPSAPTHIGDIGKTKSNSLTEISPINKINLTKFNWVILNVFELAKNATNQSHNLAEALSNMKILATN